jgi:hypothetical protein
MQPPGIPGPIGGTEFNGEFRSLLGDGCKMIVQQLPFLRRAPFLAVGKIFSFHAFNLLIYQVKIIAPKNTENRCLAVLSRKNEF